MNAYFVYSILTIDKNSAQRSACALSLNAKELVLPIFPITSPRFCYNECLYNIQQLFLKNSFINIQDIDYSFVDIQNEAVLSYINQLKTKDPTLPYDTDKDLFILCSVFIDKKATAGTTWLRIEQSMTEINNIATMIISSAISRGF